MFRSNSKTLPGSVQKHFLLQKTEYNLGDECKFIVQKAKKGSNKDVQLLLGVRCGVQLIKKCKQVIFSSIQIFFFKRKVHFYIHTVIKVTNIFCFFFSNL